jgi:hypothetical protein
MPPEPTITYVAVESMDDGEVGWLAGPFETGEAAEQWRDKFIAAAEYDPEFVYMLWPSSPDYVMEAHGL